MNHFMELAMQEARKAFSADEVPIGAVIILNNKVIASCHNQTQFLSNPIAHAEMLVIQEAARILKSTSLDACDIYVTLEPCPMCAQAISFARIRRLYFGAYNTKGGGVENGPCIYNHSTAHHKPEVYGGICENDAIALMREFFASKRLL